MEQFKVWFATSKLASYLRVFVAIFLYQAISEFQRTGNFNFANLSSWVITALVSFLPMLSRVANDEDTLS
jgi:hypothetical protein